MRKKNNISIKKKVKIYFNTKKLKYKKNRKKSKKFNQIKIESFFIKIIKELINYEFNLLKDVKIF